jgi:Spy/CpxP family protein refolding chaperone
MKARYFALSLIASVALVSAQTQQAPTPGPRGHFPPNGDFGPGGPGLERHLTRTLNLSAEQQNKVHTVLEEGRVQTKGMAAQMHTLHQSLAAAVKSGDESQIDKATQEISTLHQQETAIHAKGMAKIYAALTADQKTKVGPNLEMLLGPGGRGRGMRPPQTSGAAQPKPNGPAQQ